MILVIPIHLFSLINDLIKQQHILIHKQQPKVLLLLLNLMPMINRDNNHKCFLFHDQQHMMLHLVPCIDNHNKPKKFLCLNHLLTVRFLQHYHLLIIIIRHENRHYVLLYDHQQRVLHQLPHLMPLINNNKNQQCQLLDNFVKFTADNNLQHLGPAHLNLGLSTLDTIPTKIPSNNHKEQEQSLLLYSKSNSTTYSALPVASSANFALPTPTPTNGQNQSPLPDEYMNRNTEDSRYRSLSIVAWGSNDVLDFLSDLNLYQMMPLCESMSGKALTRLFRMCQAKPSRLYDQLNDELRVRFNGLTLPMAVYTEFLIEMDGIVGPAPDSILSISPTRPNIVERVILTPRTLQQHSQRSQSSSPATSESPTHIMN